MDTERPAGAEKALPVPLDRESGATEAPPPPGGLEPPPPPPPPPRAPEAATTLPPTESDAAMAMVPTLAKLARPSTPGEPTMRPAMC